jgi:hypothetical protein
MLGTAPPSSGLRVQRTRLRSRQAEATIRAALQLPPGEVLTPRHADNAVAQALSGRDGGAGAACRAVQLLRGPEKFVAAASAIQRHSFLARLEASAQSASPRGARSRGMEEEGPPPGSGRRLSGRAAKAFYERQQAAAATKEARIATRAGQLAQLAAGPKRDPQSAPRGPPRPALRATTSRGARKAAPRQTAPPRRHQSGDGRGATITNAPAPPAAGPHAAATESATDSPCSGSEAAIAGILTSTDGFLLRVEHDLVRRKLKLAQLARAPPRPVYRRSASIPHHETFRTTTQPPYSSTKG